MSNTLENLRTGKYEVVDNQGVSVTQHFIECLEKEFADLETKLADAQKPKEIRFNGFVVDCNYNEARKVLQEDILKMWEENKKLKESEELSNYAKCILKNKKLEEDLELSEKCCVEYEQEIQQLKQQLAEKDKEIETILKENEELVIKHNVYNWGDKIQKDKVYSLTGEALELLINRQNQKAIEQLEKVKDIINASVRDDHIIWDFDIKEHIDNQIKELKEMK